MYVYRIKEKTTAITRDNGRPTIITLEPGTEVRTRKEGPQLPDSGLVDVETTDGRQMVAMFMQDLEARGERVDPEEAGRGQFGGSKPIDQVRANKA